MQKIQINNQHNATHNAKTQPADPTHLFYQLKDLNQVQDQSRNQLCPVFLDEQSLIRQRRESHWTNHDHNQTNMLKEYQETQSRSSQNHLQPFNKIKRSYYETQADLNLKASNRKLLQDNKKLFNQCIRLRKACQKYQTNKTSEIFTVNNISQKQLIENKENMRKNAKLTKENQSLKRTNEDLQQKIRRLREQTENVQFMNYRCDKMSSEINMLQKVNDQLNKKVMELQRELEVTISRKTSRSNQSASINVSTQQSRKSEIEMDRKVSNIKLVYENEIKKLKNVITQLKKEISAKGGSQTNFSNVVNY